MRTKQFMDCFLPMPVINKLEKSCWGAKSVGPGCRDNQGGKGHNVFAKFCLRS